MQETALLTLGLCKEPVSRGCVDPTAPIPDINATIANDHAVCFGLAGMFANVYGGGDDDWFMDQSGTAVDASTRMMNYCRR